MKRSTFISAARDDVRQVLKILAVAAAGGERSKPTIAQLNEIVSRLENAEKFLSLSKPTPVEDVARRISDDDIREALSSKDIASGRSKIAALIAKAAA